MELGEKYKDLYGAYYKDGGGSALSFKRKITSDATAAHFVSFFVIQNLVLWWILAQGMGAR